MAQKDYADDRGSETEIQFYLPATVTPTFVTSRIVRLWASLRNQFIESSN